MGTLQQKEIEMEGAGVAPLKIEALDRLAEIYVDLRDKRISMLQREIAAKEELIGELHQHEESIKHPDGTLVYRYNETVIRLTPGKEKLKVELIIEKDGG
jgi:hypothetical protein